MKKLFKTCRISNALDTEDDNIFGSKFNFHRKVTPFVVSYIDNITLPRIF